LVTLRDVFDSGYREISREAFSSLTTRVEEKYGFRLELTFNTPRQGEYCYLENPHKFVDLPREYIDLHLEIDSADKSAINEAFLDQTRSTLLSKVCNGLTSCAFIDLPKTLLASNISNPGVLSCEATGVSIGDFSLVCSGSQRSGLRYYLPEARKFGWPKEIKVSFCEAEKWVDRIVNQNSEVAKTPVARALAAFSHIALEGRADNNLSIMWAMMGLEALYCDGNEGLKKQLFEKASVIFGPIKDYKRKIRGLYDFRSAFVHGSLDMPYSFTSGLAFDSVDEFFENLGVSRSISYMLLLASIQYLVSTERTVLDFEYLIMPETKPNK
jgi:hypothetical protein